MKTMLRNNSSRVEAPNVLEFDDDVKRIAGMTSKDVEDELRRIGIEPQKTLPARVYELLASERLRASAESAWPERHPGIGSYNRYVPGLICLVGFIVSVIYGSKGALLEELIGICLISLLLGSTTQLVLIKPPAKPRVRLLVTRLLIGVWIILVAFAFPFPFPNSYLAAGRACCHPILIVDTSTSTSKKRSESLQWGTEVLLAALGREIDGVEMFSLSSCRSRQLEVWATSPSQPDFLAAYQPIPPQSVFDLRGRAALSETRKAFFEKLGRAYRKTALNNSTSVSNIYTALELALSRTEGSHMRRLIVLTDSRETLDPFIRDSSRDARMATDRINNENAFIVIYDVGMIDDTQGSYMKERLATLFTHPESVVVMGRWSLVSPAVKSAS